MKKEKYISPLIETHKVTFVTHLLESTGEATGPDQEEEEYEGSARQSGGFDASSFESEEW